VNHGEVGAKRRVLVADDEPAVTVLLSEVLSYFGFEVIRAHGGVEALSLARAERPDLVLLDVMMPDLDGRDAGRAIKMDTELQRIPVVLFSSADEQEVQWRDAGADAFLQKPFSIQTLKELVQELLGGGA
jgi:adenylate cyclase